MKLIRRILALRWRRFVMWCLTAVFAVTTIAWAASVRWTIFRMCQFGDAYGLKCGGVFYHWTTEAKRQSLILSHEMDPELEWRWHASKRFPPVTWWPPVYRTSAGGRTFVTISIWLPAAMSGLLAGFLWTRERKRHRPGDCPCCGYDLTGLPSTRPCPECAQPHRDQP
jgi:hypothetical protein